MEGGRGKRDASNNQPAINRQPAIDNTPQQEQRHPPTEATTVTRLGLTDGHRNRVGDHKKQKGGGGGNHGPVDDHIKESPDVESLQDRKIVHVAWQSGGEFFFPQ